MDHSEIVSAAAKTIFAAFTNYNNNFRRINQRAKQRFETRDWPGLQKDLGERIELYTKSVSRSVNALEKHLGDARHDRAFWANLKRYFGERVNGVPDGEFSKTYFNSICRRVFNTVGIDPEIEFVTLRLEAEEHHRHLAKHHRYLNWTGIRDLITQLLSDVEFSAKYQDKNRDAHFVEDEILRYVAAHQLSADDLLRFEFLKPVFFQSSRAYLVGQMVWRDATAPLIIALKNTRSGITVDAVLMTENEVSMLFGFTRSYFFVDVEPVEGAIYFLRSLLPHKALDELYTSLGRVRQGKTERYRALTRQLKISSDQFVHAAGERGLVMLVFTLPSYDLVFKVIRDNFGYPKNVSRSDVLDKYQFVFTHDRAGRLIDTQEFRQIEFPVEKFAPELLDELLDETKQTVRVEERNVVLDHIYVERRITPLNLYIAEQPRELVEVAILDYGQAIKDLAFTNIFPGDLLLKNFGVTRHGRVIFYDYDELTLVTECNFRDLPEATFEEDDLRQDEWFYVGENDIFPEQFLKFLAMDEQLKELFLEVHGDLLTADYWREIKRQHQEKKVLEVIPYYRPPPRSEIRLAGAD
ncbi:MAG: bifunctional isocitrate dehydrogenase kinase/phosphatase [Gammaproteobacteria bacterium]